MGKCHLMWSKEPGKNKVACLWHNDSNNLKCPGTLTGRDCGKMKSSIRVMG